MESQRFIISAGAGGTIPEKKEQLSAALQARTAGAARITQICIEERR